MSRPPFKASTGVALRPQQVTNIVSNDDLDLAVHSRADRTAEVRTTPTIRGLVEVLAGHGPTVPLGHDRQDARRSS